MTDEYRQLEARIDAIDRHGTRGMESVRAHLGQMQKDMGKLESSIERIESVLQSMQIDFVRTRPGFGSWLRDLALIVPMYVLVIDLVVRGVGG